MTAYYNENDPKAAAWLRELIKAGHVAPGDVDERSIEDVAPGDLVGYRQCHFFAGIGVWSYALRAAGWPDDRPVWTGSCPCQPFSVAGDKRAFSDERHLWPPFFRLIRERRPSVVFGEQVASKDALDWLDHVSADVEREGYAIGALDLCAAGFGAPHIRQRLFWVAHAHEGRGGRHAGAVPCEEGRASGSVRGIADGAQLGGAARGVGNVFGSRPEGLAGHGDHGDEPGRVGADAPGPAPAAGSDGRLADADGGLEGDGDLQRGGQHGQRAEDGCAGGLDTARGGCGVVGDAALAGRGGHPDGADQDHRAGPTNGFWRAADWLHCTDGKWRPVEPGTFPMASGIAGRVGRLRGYGNAINAEVAREFIAAYSEIM